MTQRTVAWRHDPGQPNERLWTVTIDDAGVIYVEACDDAGGVCDSIRLHRKGAFIVPELSAPTSNKLPSFMQWLQPIVDGRARLAALGQGLRWTPILIHSSRVELMVEFKYLPPETITQRPGNSSGSAHFFGVECVWCKDLDIYAAVI